MQEGARDLYFSDATAQVLALCLRACVRACIDADDGHFLS